VAVTVANLLLEQRRSRQPAAVQVAVAPATSALATLLAVPAPQDKAIQVAMEPDLTTVLIEQVAAEVPEQPAVQQQPEQ
jgi:hypothetical protein